MPHVDEVLAQSISNSGAKRVFGVPGGSLVGLVEALRAVGVEFVLTAGETAAAYMAATDARLSGVPGICLAPLGPGAAALAAGVGAGLLDRAPLLALTSEYEAAWRPRVAQMNVDHQALFAPVVKKTLRLKPGRVAVQMHDAFRLAMAEVPGPVHVGAPADLGRGARGASEPAAPPPGGGRDGREGRRSRLSGLPGPDAAALEEAARRVQNARKPVVLAGLSAVRLATQAAFLELAEALTSPVIVSPMAKGLIGHDHPLYAGTLSLALAGPVAETLSQADLLLAVGFDPVEMNFERFAPRVPIVHLDAKGADIDRMLFPDVVELLGDPAVACRELAGHVGGKWAWDMADLATRRASLFAGLAPAVQGGGPLTPRAVLAELRRQTSEETVVTCDVGAHAHLLAQAWATSAPERLIMSNGWSSMGFGLPAAIAAALRQRDRLGAGATPGRDVPPVVCVCGDGGFLMSCGEVLTARRLGLPIVVVVVSDGELGFIAASSARAGFSTESSRLSPSGGAGLFGADAFLGAPTRSPRSPDAFAEVLATALAYARRESAPCVIEAIVDGGEYRDLLSLPGATGGGAPTARR